MTAEPQLSLRLHLHQTDFAHILLPHEYYYDPQDHSVPRVIDEDLDAQPVGRAALGLTQKVTFLFPPEIVAGNLFCSPDTTTTLADNLPREVAITINDMFNTRDIVGHGDVLFNQSRTLMVLIDCPLQKTISVYDLSNGDKLPKCIMVDFIPDLWIGYSGAGFALLDDGNYIVIFDSHMDIVCCYLQHVDSISGAVGYVRFCRYCSSRHSTTNAVSVASITHSQQCAQARSLVASRNCVLSIYEQYCLELCCRSSGCVTHQRIEMDIYVFKYNDDRDDKDDSQNNNIYANFTPEIQRYCESKLRDILVAFMRHDDGSQVGHAMKRRKLNTMMNLDSDEFSLEEQMMSLGELLELTNKQIILYFHFKIFICNVTEIQKIPNLDYFNRPSEKKKYVERLHF